MIIIAEALLYLGVLFGSLFFTAFTINAFYPIPAATEVGAMPMIVVEYMQFPKQTLFCYTIDHNRKCLPVSPRKKK